MPGYLLHLLEGHRVISHMEKKGQIGSLSEQWKNQFLLGCLLPDAVAGDKTRSHFRRTEDQNKIISLPHEEYFREKYHLQMDTPLLLGYYVHLHLDRVYLEEYLASLVTFLDYDMQEEILQDRVRWVRIRKNGDIIPLETFFSEDCLYGDYTKLNGRILEKYSITIPKYEKGFRNPIPEAAPADLQRVLQELDCYIKESKEIFSQRNIDMKILNEKEVKQFLDKTAIAVSTKI